MAKIRSDLIFTLPIVLSCDILATWLDVPEFVRLDSGYCNHEDRSQLHALYEQPELNCSLGCFSEHISWFMERRIRLQDFDMFEELSTRTDLALKYLEEFGRFIKVLRISDGSNLALIDAVGSHCPNVNTLTIDVIVDKYLVLLNAFHMLHSLDLCDESVSNDSDESDLLIGQLKEAQHLRKLRLTWGYTKTNSFVCLVQKCPHLTHFAPMCCKPLSDALMISMISCLPHLIALDLSGLYVSDVTLIAIAKGCPCIVHLDLQSGVKITDSAMYTVATSLKLKSIAIPCDFKLTDKTLEYLHSCRETLKELHIAHWVGCSGGTVNFSLSAINNLIDNTRNPCRYTWRTEFYRHNGDLSNCTHTTRQISLLTSVANTGLHLETLGINHTPRPTLPHLTSTGLYAVIKNCPRLKNIHINKKVDKTRIADVLSSHSHLFRFCNSPWFDVMSLA